MQYRKIPLTQGKFAKVDSEDFEFLSQWRWHFNLLGYAAKFCKKRGQCVTMHRYIINPKKGQEVDHINGDKLDNRKSNLRICTSSQNKCNKAKQSNNSTGLKGVTKLKTKKDSFMAQIGFNKKHYYIGVFPTAKKAHTAYCEKATELHGEFAKWK